MVTGMYPRSNLVLTRYLGVGMGGVVWGLGLVYGL